MEWIGRKNALAMKLLECDKNLAHILSPDHVARRYYLLALKRMEALLPLAIVMGNSNRHRFVS
jgi:hypothetical protein